MTLDFNAFVMGTTFKVLEMFIFWMQYFIYKVHFFKEWIIY